MMRIENKVLSEYENMQLLRYDELPEDHPQSVYWDELHTRYMPGVLKGCFRVNGRLKLFFSEQDNHVGVVAATRQGKTTSYIIPTVLSNALQKIKRNMVICDPKGEIYQACAATLVREGYDVKLLNFRDQDHSEYWNQFTEIYRAYLRARDTLDEVVLVESNGRVKNQFLGRVYTDLGKLDRAVNEVRSRRMGEVEKMISSYALMVCPSLSVKDPSWEDGARQLLEAFIYGMLEDIDRHDNPITEDNFSMNTLIKIVDSIVVGDTEVKDHGFFTGRKDDSKALILARDILISTPRNTRAGYYTSLVTKLAPFREVTTRTITSCNSFEFSDLIGGKPVAIFIDFRDELRLSYHTIQLFIQSLYTFLIGVANTLPNHRLEVPWYFVLDEFGNFPAIKDFDTVISACAGRNIWFILVMQSYAQLDNVYEGKVAKIVRDNLNVKVFFGSNDYSTLTEFSNECLSHTRIAPMGALNGEDEYIRTRQPETIPLVTRSRLALLTAGECVVREVNKPVLSSRMERYFLCEEMNSLPKADERDYICNIDPYADKYLYTVKRLRKVY